MFTALNGCVSTSAAARILLRPPQSVAARQRDENTNGLLRQY